MCMHTGSHFGQGLPGAGQLLCPSLFLGSQDSVRMDKLSCTALLGVEENVHFKKWKGILGLVLWIELGT